MTGSPGGILVDHQLEALIGSAIRPRSGAAAIDAAQVQPASVDLRLGPLAHRVRAGFLPERISVEERLADLALEALDLAGEGAVLERGCVYLIPLEEELALPSDLRARFNPRSSSGRCDLFTRVLVPGHPRFDESPRGYRGAPWLEVAPLSFPVRLTRGDRLCQLRLQRSAAALGRDELLAVHGETPLCHLGASPIPGAELSVDDEGIVALRLGLDGRFPCGWRSTAQSEPVDFGQPGAHARSGFFEPVRAEDGRCVLEPGSFYLFASRERFSIPPGLAAEMLPVDLGLGELRNNYAGFFDPGFGWDAARGGARRSPEGSLGTPAVLEVRAHDVPFLVEDGQVLFGLRFFRTLDLPRRLYGEGRASYDAQDLTLARAFRDG